MLDALLLSASLYATVQQTPPPPPPPPMPMQRRDPGTDPKGTAVIRGHVLAADKRPLRRVQVILRGAPLTSERIVGTGLEGEYEITDLPAGRFTLVARRGGYLQSDYGQRQYGEPGKPVEVAAGATLEGIDFTMERAGVISGRLSDENGEPVANASLWAMQSQFYRGRRQVVPVSAGHVRSDDTGSYRLTSLPPGEYVVVAYFRETWMSDGREKQLLAYAPSYFPGTTSVAEAVRVKVAAGQEAGAIDFNLVPGRAATVSGSVMASDGSPLAGASVMLEQEIMGPGGGTFSSAGSGRANDEGTWRIPNVPPGTYNVRASGNSGDRGSESASLSVTITGEDISGLALRADAGGLIAGRVQADGGVPLPAGTLRVFAQSATFDRNSLQIPPGQGDGLVAADGTFSRRAAAGPVLVRATVPSGWYVKRVFLGDREVTDVPQTVQPGEQLSPFTVVIARTLATVSGSVTDGEGTSVERIVVVFPADAARWQEAAGSVRTTRADRTGRFRIDNVRPGDYLVAAADHLVQSSIYDPDVLAALRDGAAKLTVGDEPVSIDVRVRK